MKRKIQCSLGAALLICAVALCQTTPTRAQQATDASEMEKQIDTIERQQLVLLQKLTELQSQLLGASGIAAAAPTQTGIGGELFQGNPAAPVALIEYGDYECPYCGKFERDTLPALLQNYVRTGKVKFLYRDLPARPIQVSSGSRPAATALARKHTRV